MVDFHGWLLPLHYGSQIEEHNSVRNSQVCLTVSHMGIVDLHGPDVQKFLRVLLANNIDKMSGINSALYSCMLSNDAVC